MCAGQSISRTSLRRMTVCGAAAAGLGTEPLPRAAVHSNLNRFTSGGIRNPSDCIGAFRSDVEKQMKRYRFACETVRSLNRLRPMIARGVNRLQ